MIFWGLPKIDRIYIYTYIYVYILYMIIIYIYMYNVIYKHIWCARGQVNSLLINGAHSFCDGSGEMVLSQTNIAGWQLVIHQFWRIPKYLKWTNCPISNAPSISTSSQFLKSEPSTWPCPKHQTLTSKPGCQLMFLIHGWENLKNI